MDKLKRERTPLRNTITRTTNEIKSGLSLEEVDIILIRVKFERLTILNDRLILIDDKIKEILLDDPRSTEAQINDEMELCETYSLQVGIVAQKVKEYESKLAAPCDDEMSQSSTSDVKRQIKLPKFELKKYTEGQIEFLKQEGKNAERISFVAEGFEPSLPLKQGKRENNPPKIHTASALFVGKTNLPCLFCDKDNHLSQNCFKAAKMLESDRLKRVQDAKVCFKCLRKNLLKKDCRSFVRCNRCQGPHFEIMCRGTSHSQEHLNWRSDNRSHNSLAEQNEGSSEHVTAMANQVCTNNISLMTLIVKIKGPKRSKMVRVLLDSGSQKSYIRRSLAKELDLPKVGEVKLNKFLFGGQTTGEKAHSIFYFQLDNVDEGKAFKMEALEETIICGNISPVETGPRQWELDKKGINLTKEGIGTIPNNLEIAEKVLIRSIQRDSLGKGQISHLKPKVKSDGLMYIETKLLYDQSPEEFRKPVLLPCDHPITEQLIRETHSNNCHAGVHFLLSKLREKFWILKARKTIKRVVRGCIICRRHAEKANTIPCAPLPKDRLFMGRPFEVTGVDLMGPLYLKNGQKIWITLFTCAVYRAVHSELVEGLDATNFIMALERFVHRRGRPVEIYSDNGTNFKRTNRLFTNLNWDKIARVNYVQLETLICHVEAIINTRPLTYISETEDDLIPITPQMFIQNNFGSFDESHELSPDNTRQHFRKLQQIKKELKERFYKEYLAVLVQKGNETEGRRFLPGEVVLIGRDDQKRIFWPLGRILELYPGKDGRERVARVRTATGEFVRPLKRLFSLELGSDISREVRVPKTEGIKAQEIPTDGEQSIFTRSGREVKKTYEIGGVHQ
ncbi:hypothetical protein LAZ67_5002423 [Cordylochernes scorpioides]|uniref:Integrase catalytic domain-containing protein n=1 Tax=Cordylochernes scorpioides TaxID=51811 RepID=A0ABY6KJA9_9ARAC|nr:hypothetical protein LAZ67_5002423 [Cordylochernes scorpioides]